MKRLLIILLGVMLLVACGNDEATELNAFIEDYNRQAELFNKDAGGDALPEAFKIVDDEIKDPKKEDNGYWQKLIDYETGPLEESFNVQVKYDNNQKLNGYHVYTNGGLNSDYYYEQGIVSAFVIARALGLDLSKFGDYYDLAVEGRGTDIEYTDSDYKISFLSVAEMNALIINFDKQE